MIDEYGRKGELKGSGKEGGTSKVTVICLSISRVEEEGQVVVSRSNY
jgi:hypothetical protein